MDVARRTSSGAWLAEHETFLATSTRLGNAGGAALIGWFCVVLAGSLAGAEDWPRWRGPRGDGTWQGPALPERWPEGGLPVVWRAPIGGGFAGVSVVGDRVYTMDRQTEPQEVERVLCFDARSGKLLWNHSYPVAYGDLDYGSGPRAAPTIHQGRVYTLGAVGHAFCLDAGSGAVVWAKDFVAGRGAEIPTWGLAASPVVWRDRVIFHAGLRPDGSYTAHDLATGRELWRASTDRAGYATPILIKHDAGEQLVCWSPQHVLGIDPQSGELLWQVPYEVTYGVSIATPIFQDGIVFVAGYWEGSKAIRLGAGRTDAKLVWEDNRQLRGIMSQPLYRDGFAYLLDKQHGITCFHLSTGKVEWSEAREEQRLTKRDRNPQASLVWTGDGDRILALNAEGELVLGRLNPQGFEEQGRTKVIERTWAHPAFAGRHMYARSDQELVCIELVPAQ